MRWRASWALVLFALAVRIGLALPAGMPGDPAIRVAALSVLCDGHQHNDGTPHLPADAGEGVLLLVLGDAFAVPVLGAGLLLARSARSIIIAPAWCVPPVRGPPPRCTFARYAQGPPA